MVDADLVRSSNEMRKKSPRESSSKPLWARRACTDLRTPAPRAPSCSGEWQGRKESPGLRALHSRGPAAPTWTRGPVQATQARPATSPGGGVQERELQPLAASERGWGRGPRPRVRRSPPTTSRSGQEKAAPKNSRVGACLECFPQQLWGGDGSARKPVRALRLVPTSGP